MKFVKRIALAFVVVFGLSFAAHAATDCTFSVVGTEMVLNDSCSTDQTIVVPNGVTMDLNGNTITGHDPAGGHFIGAVVMNGGSTYNITNGTITVSNLSDACDPGADRLRGVMFQGASGSVTNLQVLNINQGASGCQEGNAIEVRNFGNAAGRMHVSIDSVTATGYQKTGVVANGAVDVTVTNSNVDGLGPVNYIARNGIQFGFGGTGRVSKTIVAGNAYSGGIDASGGILIVGGPCYGFGLDFSTDVQVMQNTLHNNDVGVYISECEADNTPPNTATNIKVVNNDISSDQVTHQIYQAGVTDGGNNDKIINNKIYGIGYISEATAGPSEFTIDTNPLFTNAPKVHANK